MSRFCKVCDRKTLHTEEQRGCGHLIFALVLAIPTAGLSLLWLAVIGFVPTVKRCQTCGTGRIRI
jgi:hypothetical protein